MTRASIRDHVVHLSAEEYETLLWALEALRATFDAGDVPCEECEEECAQGSPTVQRHSMRERFDLLRKHLVTETE